jgi:hypothetical protein
MLYAFFRHLETLCRTCEHREGNSHCVSRSQRRAKQNSSVSLEARDDAPTVCAISLLAAILSNYCTKLWVMPLRRSSTAQNPVY